MKDAFWGLFMGYRAFVGNSKIVVAVVLAFLVIVLINEKNNDDLKGRRINPAVFLLSIWSGIAYAATKVISGKKKPVFFSGLLFIIAGIMLSGNCIISSEGYENSVYYYTDYKVTIASVLAIIMYLVLYYLIAVRLFQSIKDRITFMFIVILLHLFGFYSVGATWMSLFLSPVTIESLVIHDVMPLILWLYFVYKERIDNWLSQDNEDEVAIDENDDYEEEWDMKKHKILNMRNMAVAFIVLTIALLAAVFVLNKKINSLYDATVLLENAAKSKMTVYEVNNSDGSVALTLMISPKGSVTAVGGGKNTNGTECYNLISKYTEKVDKWYLLGNDEDNKGAYDFCREQGIEVTETYVLSGVEKLD